jgi:hypothetical protein
MRLLKINLLAIALVLFGAFSASAYQLSLVPTTPTAGVNVGDIISFDVFLDTEGASGIQLFTSSLVYDPAVVQYRPDLSDAEDYYPLYAPSAGKGQLPTWLEPAFDPPALWVAPAPGTEQVDVSFLETANGFTTATATNLYLGTLAFQAVGAGTSEGYWGFQYQTNTGVFRVSDGGGGAINVAGTEAFAPGSATMSVIPEPTTALLVGLGLVGLGVAGRRRA